MAAGERILGDRPRVGRAGQFLRSGDRRLYGADIRCMAGAGSVQLQCLAFVIEQFMQLAQRLVACFGRIRFLLHFLPMPLDADDDSDDLVACDCRIQAGFGVRGQGIRQKKGRMTIIYSAANHSVRQRTYNAPG